ncbi:MAG: hypothetical protein JWR26_2604 [Pedosphaera sp.]|nr:hypothetical protein [Pedosphaera sp.]
MNHIGAKGSRDLKDGKDLKDAVGCLGGRVGLADGAGWAAHCIVEARAKGGQAAMPIPLERGLRGRSIGLLRPGKAGKGRLRPDIFDAFIFSGGMGKTARVPGGEWVSKGGQNAGFILLINRPCPVYPGFFGCVCLFWQLRLVTVGTGKFGSRMGRVLAHGHYGERWPIWGGVLHRFASPSIGLHRFASVCIGFFGCVFFVFPDWSSRGRHGLTRTGRMLAGLAALGSGLDGLASQVLQVSCPEGMFASRNAISPYHLLDGWRRNWCVGLHLLAHEHHGEL